MTMHRPGLLAIALLLGACASTEAAELGVEVSFDSRARSAQPLRVDVWLVDSCESVSLGVAPEAFFGSTFSVREGASGPPLGSVPSGEYALYAVARDASCFAVATACEPVTVGDGSGTLRIELGPFAGLGCGLEDACDSETGRCIGPDDREVDCRTRADETPCASDGAVGMCRAGACCTGCWDGSTCHPGADNVRCGAGGGACSTCDCASDRCEAGDCLPSTPLVEVDVGADHACGIAEDGHLWCWGSRRNGELGLGDSTPAGCDGDRCTVPVEMVGLLDGVVPEWAAVSAGTEVTCAIRQADGALHCWGSNAGGRMGAPEGVLGANAPVLISSEPHTSVDGEGAGGCAIRAADASLWCWGNNDVGQVGQGTSGGVLYEPQQVPFGSSWEGVSVGRDFVLAVDDDRLWGWGLNSDGQLGTGQSGGASNPALTGFIGASVEAGDGTACAIDAVGAGYCWGDNLRGQVGNGEASGNAVTSPTPIVGDLSFDHFALGLDMACAVAVDGSLHCWGRNRYGQLGVGDSNLSLSSEPLQVEGSSAWVKVSAGGESVCALRTNGSLWCWGRNHRGQLGTGDTSNRSAPTRLCF